MCPAKLGKSMFEQTLPWWFFLQAQLAAVFVVAFYELLKFNFGNFSYIAVGKKDIACFALLVLMVSEIIMDQD